MIPESHRYMKTTYRLPLELFDKNHLPPPGKTVTVKMVHLEHIDSCKSDPLGQIGCVQIVWEDFVDMSSQLDYLNNHPHPTCENCPD